MLKTKYWSILTLACFMFTVFGLSIPEAQATEDGNLHIDVYKTIDDVECVEEDGQVVTTINGTYEIKNESGEMKVRLDEIRDWVSEFPFDDQPIGGAYSLSISDNAGFDSPIFNYSVGGGIVNYGEPPFQTLNYGPIMEGETMILYYTLSFQGGLPDKLYNSVEFNISDYDDSDVVGCEAFGDHEMFAGPEICRVITPVPTSTPTPLPTTTIAPTPSPSETFVGGVGGVSMEVLPETGGRSNSGYWALLLLVVLGVIGRLVMKKTFR